MAEPKVHPSEMMEFSSTFPTISPDLERAANDNFDQKTTPLTATTTSTNTMGFKDALSDIEFTRTESRGSVTIPRMNSSAMEAAQSEHKMTFWHAIKIYPKAIFWSAMISLAIVMEGYDTALINSFYAFPEFVKHYGVRLDNGQYQVTTTWQTSLSNASAAAAIVGLILNGFLTEKFGYRHTMMGALLGLTLAIFLSFFAFNIQTLLAGQVLCGISWGVFSTLTTTYAAEVMPLTLRGYLTANVNMCWLVGQVFALAVLRGFLKINTQWSYRIPFGLQWFWIVIVLTTAYFAPESPWFLVRKGRFEEAKKVLVRLTNHAPEFNVENTLAMMEHTDTVEKRLNNGRRQRNDLSYFECFRGTNLRRTEIACMIFMIQNLCGLPVISFAAYFYRQIGFGIERSFDITMGMQGVAICGGCLAIVLMKNFGRRILYLCGLAILFVILLTGGIIATLKETRGTLWALAGLIILFIFVFDLTIGPLTYCIVAEIPSTRLRVNTVILARISYNVCCLVTNPISSHMLNPLAWNLRGKSCYFWAVSCAFCFAYCWFRLPETKGLTYHELDILFEKKANARKFADIQKKLDETGYFGIYEEKPEQATWGVRRMSIRFSR